MRDMRYRVVFKGEVAPDADIKEVKEKVASVFKADSKKIEKLFSGENIVIKKNANLETCEKLSKAFKNAGAISYIEKEKATGTNDVDNTQDKEPGPPPLPSRQELDRRQAVAGRRVKQADEKFCSTCGEIIQIKTLSCPYCGKKQKKEGMGCMPIAAITIGICFFAFAILGILAAIAIPQFASYRTQSFEANVKSELRNLYAAENVYYQVNKRYADNFTELDFDLSQSMVILEIVSGDEYCFEAKGEMDQLDTIFWINCEGVITEEEKEMNSGQ